MFLAHTLPYPPTRGGFIRTYNILRLLAGRFDLRIVCFDRVGASRHASVEARAKAIKHLSQFGEIEVFPVPQANSHLRLFWDHLRSLFLAKVFTFYRHESAEFRARIRELLAVEEFDLIHVDSLDLVNILPILQHKVVTCTHHNVESELLKERARVERTWLIRQYIKYQAWLQRKAEREWCPKVSMNITVSDRDAAALLDLAPGGQFITVPNGVDLDKVTPGQSAGSEIDILGLGGLSWFPNRDAVHYLGEDILPQIRCVARRAVSVTWVGQGSTSDRNTLERQFGICSPGFVVEVLPYIRRATCYVLPYRFGGGTKLKLLEALAAGSAIVTTSVGAIGVDIRHEFNALIADTPKQFACAVVRVLDDEALRLRLGQNAQETAAALYGWNAIGRKIGEFYMELINSTGTPRANTGTIE